MSTCDEPQPGSRSPTSGKKSDELQPDNNCAVQQSDEADFRRKTEVDSLHSEEEPPATEVVTDPAALHTPEVKFDDSNFLHLTIRRKLNGSKVTH